MVPISKPQDLITQVPDVKGRELFPSAEATPDPNLLSKRASSVVEPVLSIWRLSALCNASISLGDADAYGLLGKGNLSERLAGAIVKVIGSVTAAAWGAGVVSQSSFSSASRWRSFHRSQTCC
jgi:hypothetical protein